MTTAVVRTFLESDLTNVYGYVGRIRHDVVYGRTLLRLGNQCAELFRCGVGVDGVVHLDAVESVSHIAVDAENPLNVHASLEGSLDRPELDASILSDRGNA